MLFLNLNQKHDKSKFNIMVCIFEIVMSHTADFVYIIHKVVFCVLFMHCWVVLSYKNVHVSCER